MRLLFTGAAPWVNSGYGKPLRYLLPRLIDAGHDVALAAFFGWDGTLTDTDIDGRSLRIYPSGRNPYFNDIIEYHVRDWNADAVITLQDVWILEDWGKRDFVWCPWLPIDTHPVSPVILKAIEGCHTPITWGKWAREELVQHGWMQTRVIPFGIDLDIHKPADKRAARAAVGIPDDDRYLVGMVAANSSYPSRKSFPEALQAWRKFKDDGGAGTLYLHTTITHKGRSGIDLQAVLNTLGLSWTTTEDPVAEHYEDVDVLFSGQYRMWSGAYNDKDLANVYNALDLYLAPAMAEGFGIPILEAQACGVPVVTLESTAMPEITFNGRCITPEQLSWEQEGGWRAIAPVEKILEALWDGVDGKFEHVVPDEVNVFEWGRVVERDWLPFLEELAGEICD